MGENQLKSPDILVEPLTRREREILAFLAENLTGPEIAEKLTLAVSSVRWHIHHIYGKLSVNNRRQALARARELGLLVSATPLPAAAPTPRHNLPASLTSFIGRQEQVQAIGGLITDPARRLVTLTGAGGVGKTRLALHIAEIAFEWFSHGAWLVELASLEDPRLVPYAVAAVLGIQESADRAILPALIDNLREKHMLLVLDNCEHLVEACAKLAETLLRSCRELHILATSREVLGIDGETPYPVPSLPSPEARRLPRLEDLAHYEAVRLFVERAQSVSPGFAVTEENAASLALVCQQLDGIPLAIELAAARLKVLDIAEIAARLEDRFRLLTGGSRTAPPRYQTVYASIDWSYSLLSEQERILFRRLSVFSGGWTLGAAEAICAGTDESLGTKHEIKDDLHPAEVLDLLSGLVNKSLVNACLDTGKETRYEMLETIRQYAGEKLAREKLLESGETMRLRDRHLAYFLEMAEETEKKLHTAERLNGLDQLEVELDNLRAALNWSQGEAASEKAAAGLRLACALAEFWFLNGKTEAKEWLKKGLEIIGEAPQTATLRARAFWVMSRLNIYELKGPIGGEIVPEAISLAKIASDSEVFLALSIAQAGQTYDNGDVPAALTLARECIEIACQMGSKWWLAHTLECLARILAQENQSEARSYAEESISLYNETGDRWSVAYPLSQLGLLALHQGDYEAAHAYFQSADERFKEGKDKEGSMWCLAWHASISFFQKDYPEMQSILEKCLVLAREISFVWAIGVITRRLGIAVLRQGDRRKAVEYFLSALAPAREREDIFEVIMILEGLAGVSIAAGEPARGARLLGAVEALVAQNTRRLYVEEQAEFDHWRAEAAAQLDQAAFASAWAEGQAMKMEAATAEMQKLAADLLAPAD